MGLFKKKEKQLYAIANGKSIAIENVPDEVFSTKMMGDGIAILPTDGHIYAPCDGEISMIMEHSLHAIGLVNADGMEILLHIGLDSVELMGEGFTAHVSIGDQVSKGDLLLSFDLPLFQEREINPISMLVLVEANQHEITKYYLDEDMEKGSSIWLSYR